MPGWRLPSNMPPEDVRGLPRRPASRPWGLWLALCVIVLLGLAWAARKDLQPFLRWVAAERRTWNADSTAHAVKRVLQKK